MQKDWKKIAKANGLAISGEGLDRIAQTLDGLEQSFRPLVRALGPETDPAPVFRAALEDAE
ncbi:MAG TPA: hypothetical protein VMU80_04735 [Bryobacteraceae bacterium]|nr:hypothetical protein [Bryobacteraceae bacterium]